MSIRALIVLVVAALALVPAGAQAKGTAHTDLWATVNLCDTPSRPGAVGVRVSIPRERGAPQQWARTRLVQSGTTFTFPPPKPGARIVLRGAVDVEWRDGTKVVDRARVTTTAGHRDSTDRQRRVSRSSCEIMR